MCQALAGLRDLVGRTWMRSQYRAVQSVAWTLEASGPLGFQGLTYGSECLGVRLGNGVFNNLHG